MWFAKAEETRTALSKRLQMFLTVVIGPFLSCMVATFAATLALNGCGTETGNPGDEPSPGIGNSQSLVAIDVSSQLSELADSLAEIDAADDTTASLDAASGMALADDHEQLALAPARLATKERNDLALAANCSVNANSATVVQDKQRNFSGSYRNDKVRQIDFLVSGLVKNSFGFSRRDEVAVGCTRNGRRPLLRADDYKQLRVTTEINESLSRTLKRLTSAGAVDLQKVEELSRKGNRQVDFSIDSLTSAGLVYSRSSTGTVEQSSKVTFTEGGKASEVKEVKSTLTIAKENPLVIVVEKPGIYKPWTSKTVRSGTFTSIAASGTKTVTKVENLVLKAGSNCQPESGKVTGAVYPTSSSTESSSTFVITFYEGGAVISFDKQNYQEELAVNLCATDE